MIDTRTPVIRPPAEGPVIGVVGDVYRFLATGDDTAGSYSTWEALVGPGGGPPPHVHSREAESFYVIEGEITFTIDGRTVVASAGSFSHMPIGTPHAFKNATDRPARMLISVVPAGLEKMFFEVGQAVEPGATLAPLPTQADIEKLVRIAPNYGIEILIP